MIVSTKHNRILARSMAKFRSRNENAAGVAGKRKSSDRFEVEILVLFFAQRDNIFVKGWKLCVHGRRKLLLFVVTLVDWLTEH